MILPTIMMIAATLTQAALAEVSICRPSSFHPPNIDGVRYLNLQAQEVRNFTRTSLPPGTVDGATYTVDFCNVTVSYEHPGWHDEVSVTVWLPISPSSWNGRLWALGGAGYSASGGPIYLTQAVGKGFVALATDSGHEATLESARSAEWALTSTGNLDLPLLYNFGYQSLGEMTSIGKKITSDFFGSEPKYSYFSGCSNGGRQAMELAQRFPNDYTAAAPAMNFETFIPAAIWSELVMRNLSTYPSACEVNAFTEQAIQACDLLDGLEDGIVSRPELCDFDPSSAVGTRINCNGTEKVLSAAAADVVRAAWLGPRDPEGNFSWPGLNVDASLTGYISTTCSSDYQCTQSNSELFTEFWKYFLAKHPAFNVTNLTDEQYFDYLKTSQRVLGPILAADDPDLSGFQKAGGKMISWHGLADETIPPVTNWYYDQVMGRVTNVHQFYRHFEAPGVGHCMGGLGPLPGTAFDQLISWVEEGVVPDKLQAVGQVGERDLCPYPSVQTFAGESEDGELNFECV
ncbi:hypothetical protein CBER1_01228 [Cercospora berteroae]|uniref:Carboxylic ester hydrolase n=1 Tax=Cercospora berteroae TaxID=357750 RepID=A0A2S6CIU1_9PEZI|nr:hypothetical protein CBER1_01228 [Cercospora berteroae]